MCVCVFVRELMYVLLDRNYYTISCHFYHPTLNLYYLDKEFSDKCEGISPDNTEEVELLKCAATLP